MGTMKPKFKLFKRGRVYYSQEISTGKRKSLGTSRKPEAEQILAAMNASNGSVVLQMKIGEAYLASLDPAMTVRIWDDVIKEFSQQGAESTVERKERVFRNPSFENLKLKKLVETTPEDFFEVMSKRTTAVIAYLKQLQNYALDMGYLFRPVMPAKRFPVPLEKQSKRAITLAEHEMIIAAESNAERKAFYQMLWETGAAQSDCAELKAEDFDREKRILVFRRKKTNSICRLSFGDEIIQILDQLPRSGFLFPKLRQGTWRTRAAEFGRRRRLLKLEGISLHSYRYSWAERAFRAGVSERHAMAALGHGTKAITRAYARSAEVVCPSINPPNK